MLGRNGFFHDLHLIFTLSSLLCGVAWNLDFCLSRAYCRARPWRLAAMAQAIWRTRFRRKNAGWLFRVWRHGHRGPQYRADAGRLDHGQLFVAVVF